MRTTGPGESALLVVDAVDLLTAHAVDYAVAGAMAASMYGVVRASVNADVLVAATQTRVRDLEALFIGAGFCAQFGAGGRAPFDFELALSDRHGNRLSLWAGLPGLESAAFGRALPVSFQGSKLKVLGREDFIAVMVNAGQPQALSDARHAIEAPRRGLDVVLLRRLTARFGDQASASLERMLENR